MHENYTHEAVVLVYIQQARLYGKNKIIATVTSSVVSIFHYVAYFRAKTTTPPLLDIRQNV